MKLNSKKAQDIDRVPNRKLYLEPSDNQNILGQVDMPLCGSQISHHSRDVAISSQGFPRPPYNSSDDYRDNLFRSIHRRAGCSMVQSPEAYCDLEARREMAEYKSNQVL